MTTQKTFIEEIQSKISSAIPPASPYQNGFGNALHQSANAIFYSQKISYTLDPVNDYDKGFMDGVDLIFKALRTTKPGAQKEEKISVAIQFAIDRYIARQPIQTPSEASLQDEGPDHLHDHDGNTCKQCDSPLGRDGYCSDQTCVYSDWPQAIARNDISVFSDEEIESKYSVKKRDDTSPKPLSLSEFVALKKEVSDIGGQISDSSMKDIPGYMYPGECFIEKTDSGFSLMIGRSDWVDTDLSKLEEILYKEWYLRECV